MKEFQLPVQYGTTLKVEGGFYVSITQIRDGDSSYVLLSADQLDEIIARAPGLLQEMKGGV